MPFHSRLLVSTVILCSTLVACGDSDTNTAVSTSASEVSASSSNSKIEAGMTEQAVSDMLGEVSFTQTRNIDDLTITHSEWTNDAGTISVQFHNGKAQFSQFVAAKSED